MLECATLIVNNIKSDVGVHAFNPSTREAEEGESKSSLAT
jgi:hypothetical protein